MRSLLTWLAAALALALLTLPGAADEVIRSFDSDVTLRANGTVDVTEIIVVRSEGIDINHGIYRDIFTVLANDDGSKLHSSLTVLGVTRDGNPEAWYTQDIRNGERIYIGDADVTLRPGTYRYTIHYTMTRMGRSFADHDELYWNVTGNYWNFPIENAYATVTLPPAAVISDLSVYTGPVGSRQSDATVKRLGDNKAGFRATKVLTPGEGMTVSVSFQPGILDKPAGVTAALYYLSDHRALIIPAIAVFLVLLYYYFAWDAVGRDPEKGTVIPRFYPPAGFSPGLTHYVWAWGWRNSGWQAFTAALVNLGVKGFLEIGRKGKKTTFAATGKQQGRAALTPGETAVFDFFRGRGTVTINKKTGPALARARDAFTGAIETENRQVYFRNNYIYVVIGIALSVLCLVAMLALGILAFEWFIGAVFGGIFLTMFGALFRGLWFSGGSMARYFKLAIIAFFLVNFAVTGSSAAVAFLPDISIGAPVVGAATIIALNLIFAVLMRAPTVQGRKIMDQIDGFRMYLETAEKNRLEFVEEPDLTKARFEGILPYAMALGVEKHWSERFQNELARNAVADASGAYVPLWYAGRDFNSATLSHDIADISSSMSAAMAAAQPSTSSSSGSGGGGSSGGGGGGGGGGGW